MNKFYETLALKVKEKEGVELNPQSLSLLEAVHKTEGERTYRPRGAKKPISLDPLIKDVRESFAIDLCDRIIEWIPERVTDVVLTGGGGAFFRADVEKLLTEAGLKTHLAQPSREANSLGQYIYAEAQLQSAAATAK
jgi:plasmid segregation protein ParM